ncbi:YadA-like family protein, partial [Sneathia vaginalis]|uniref:YadA-like family protein n=1 Tax=Sneathia vaginalis TaxID=187101 RepID=UPI002889A4AD
DLDDKSDGHMAANKNYVDEKVKTITGDIEKLKNKGLKFAGNTGETKELNDKVNIKGEGTEANNFESAKGNINVVANDSGVELKLAANLKNMKSFETEKDKDGNSTKLDQKGLTITDKDDKNSGTKDNPRHTIEITKDKIVFKKEYKEGTENKSDNGIVIDNSKGTISGVKDGNTPDSVVTKGYIDNKLKSLDGNNPFEYYEKNKDAVLGKDGKAYKAGTIVTENGDVYAKGTQKVEGKYFKESDKVTKQADGKFYKEADIKDKKYDEKEKKWVDNNGKVLTNQPTEATPEQPLTGDALTNQEDKPTKLIRGKDDKFYPEDATYDETTKKYMDKDGKELIGKEAKDVVIKAQPNSKPMTLTNIGDGRMIANSTDAVNGGQVFEALKGKLNADADNLTDKGKTNLIEKLSTGADISNPSNVLVTDKQVNEHLNKNYYNKTQVNNMISTIDNKSTVALEKSELALGGVANAVAMANLVQVNSYSRHRHNLSAAYGYYGGSHALAVGFSGTNEERNFVYKLSGSVNNKGNLAFGVGAGVMLGEEHDTFPSIDNKKINEVTKKLDEANKKISEYEDDKKQTAKKFKELEDKYENDKKESNKKLQEMERKLEMLMKKFK